MLLRTGRLGFQPPVVQASLRDRGSGRLTVDAPRGSDRMSGLLCTVSGCGVEGHRMAAPRRPRYRRPRWPRKPFRTGNPGPMSVPACGRPLLNSTGGRSLWCSASFLALTVLPSPGLARWTVRTLLQEWRATERGVSCAHFRNVALRTHRSQALRQDDTRLDARSREQGRLCGAVLGGRTATKWNSQIGHQQSVANFSFRELASKFPQMLEGVRIGRLRRDRDCEDLRQCGNSLGECLCPA